MQTDLRALVRYVSACSILVTCFTFSTLAQAPPRTKRATPAEIDALLTKHPDLSSGFSTPQNAKVQHASKTRGGITFDVTSAGGKAGTVTVVGPPTVMERDVVGTLIDIGIALWDKL